MKDETATKVGTRHPAGWRIKLGEVWRPRQFRVGTRSRHFLRV